MRTTAFDRATDVIDQGGGRYATELSPDWNVGDKPNGGYLAAVAARAMSVAGGQPDPLSVTAHSSRCRASSRWFRFALVRSDMAARERVLVLIMAGGAGGRLEALTGGQSPRSPTAGSTG